MLCGKSDVAGGLGYRRIDTLEARGRAVESVITLDNLCVMIFTDKTYFTVALGDDRLEYAGVDEEQLGYFRCPACPGPGESS